jgi:uncharacterized cupin superfamily protein
VDVPKDASPPYTGMRYDQMPGIWGGFARLVRPALGITSFGCNVMNLPPDYATKPHDERETGQEELYVALAGSGAVVVGEAEERLELDPEHAVRVGPETSRTLVSGPEGMRVLIVGGTPGQAYVPLEWSSGDASDA